MIIFVDKKIFKQKEAQWPITFPPNKTILLGKKNEGRNIKEIKTIPVKKNRENKKFLIILSKLNQIFKFLPFFNNVNFRTFD